MYEKQMELFEDGGLMQEGGMVDEVSGNDVPPGSTRKEVRDDIPAMLSEGEFVFPADVVRYFGLERLMEMRQQAKMGLKRMEEMGQMGNSEEATIPDDLPFTLEDLEFAEPQEYNQGGVIKAQQGVFVTPSSFANTQPYTPTFVPPSSVVPTNTQGFTTGYTPTFVNQPDITTGTTTDDSGDTDEPFVPEVGDVYVFKKYKNTSTGEIRDIPFHMGTPVIPIPDGFVPYSEDETTEPEDVTDTSVQTSQVLDTGGGGDNFDPSTGTPTGQETKPVTEFSNEDLMSNLNQSRMLARASLGIGAVINPAIGVVVGVSAKARYNDLLEEAQRRGLDTGDAERMGSIFGGESTLYEGLKDFSGDEKVTFADTWLGDLLGLDGEAGVQGPGLKESRQGARRGATTTAPRTPAVEVAEPSQPSQSADAQAEAERQRQAEAQAEANRQAQAARAEAERQRQAEAQAEANRQAQESMLASQRDDRDSNDRPDTWDGGGRSVSEADVSASRDVQSGREAAAGKDFSGREISSDKYSGSGYTGGRAKGGFITKPKEQPKAAPKKKRGIAARNKK